MLSSEVFSGVDVLLNSNLLRSLETGHMGQKFADVQSAILRRQGREQENGVKHSGYDSTNSYCADANKFLHMNVNHYTMAPYWFSHLLRSGPPE